MLVIKSRDDAVTLTSIEPNRFNVVLISGDFDKEEDRVLSIKKNAKSHIHLIFDDITNPHSTVAKPPSKELVAQGVDWVKDLKDDYIVSCRAGISRSSAMAYLIATKFFGPRDAVKILNPDIHYPNKLIVKLGSEILGNPEIYTICRTYVEFKM